MLLEGTSLLVTPSTKLTFIGFLNYKESTRGHSVTFRGYRTSGVVGLCANCPLGMRLLKEVRVFGYLCSYIIFKFSKLK